MTWVTTSEFLDQFSLSSIMDLPGMDDLKASGLLDRRPAVDAMAANDLFTKVEREEEMAAED